MKQRTNIAELLKDAPYGYELDSPVLGKVKLLKVNCNYEYPIKVRYILDSSGFCKDIFLTKFGTFVTKAKDVSCVIFPKGTKTWENFKAPWKHRHFEPFQKVLVGLICNSKQYWRADLYSHYQEDIKEHCTLKESMVQDNLIIPYEGNEDKLGKDVE